MHILFPGVAESLNIRLLSAGYGELDWWWTETDLIREFWRLYLNYDDGAVLQVESESYPLPKDRITLVPAGVDFQATLEHPMQQFFILFEFVGWPAQAAREVVPGPVSLERDPRRDDFAEQLRGEVAKGAEIEPILASRLKALIHMCISQVLSDIPEDRARSFLHIAGGQQEIVTVLHYIDRHLDQPLNNSRLAEVALASESRFIRRFREATGRTPGRYVQDRRLRRAAELLVSTDQSIDQIAESCGFANRYYFTRVFAQRMGCPPARYRTDRPYMGAAS